MKLGEIVVHMDNYNFTSLKSDEKQKSFINSQFFCSEIQSVSIIVKIIHSGIGKINYGPFGWRRWMLGDGTLSAIESDAKKIGHYTICFI